MLRLTGSLADGWLPSEPYLQPGDLSRGNKIIDEAATAAGRKPADIRRLLNVNDPSVDHLVEQALTDGIDTFILMGDDPAALEELAARADDVRDQVAAARAGADRSAVDDHPQPADSPVEVTEPQATVESEYDRLGIRPTPDTGVRLSSRRLWDESLRPHREPSGPEVEYSQRGKMVGRHLIDVHDHLRRELETVRSVIDQVRGGAMEVGRARSVINDLTMRQNDWTLGAYCAAYCRTVAEHHTLEDRSVFPHLRKADHDLGAILDRLVEEHHVIHEVLEEVDRRLVGMITHPGDHRELSEAVDLLTDTLLSHLAYEEQQLVEPLARHGFSASRL
jgi:hemerythrin-like domain-containing protein